MPKIGNFISKVVDIYIGFPKNRCHFKYQGISERSKFER